MHSTDRPEKPEVLDEAQTADTAELLSVEIIRSACKLAETIHARCILVYAEFLRYAKVLEGFSADVQLVVIESETGKLEGEDRKLAEHYLHVPGTNLTRMGKIKIALLAAMSRGIFERGDRIVCLSGSPLTGVLDTIVVMEIGEEHEMFVGSEAQSINEHVQPEVFDKVLEIAVQLAHQGREGKPIGAIFVVGDEENVAKYTDQLIINPFRGYSEDERNVMDPRLTETVKELATIDGAFVIRGDGIIQSAGTYLKPALAGEKLPPGLGARHAAAGSLSASTNAIILTVSESTGTVRVFMDGRIVTEIEKRIRAG